MTNRLRLVVTCVFTSLLVSPIAFAADHIDSPAAVNTPSADITDFYSWMTADASHLNMVLNVTPFATADSMWSDATVYAMHVSSMGEYGGAETKTQVLCRFYKADGTGIECWADDEYVAGDPSDPAGLASDSGKLKVFAGLRNDPFFFELVGFGNAVAAVIDAAPNLTFDADMCPVLDDATSATLIGLLTSGKDGAPASDTLAGANVLSLVVQLDKTTVNAGGDFLATWAATHALAQ